jgi:hypothetical protein
LELIYLAVSGIVTAPFDPKINPKINPKKKKSYQILSGPYYTEPRNRTLLGYDHFRFSFQKPTFHTARVRGGGG